MRNLQEYAQAGHDKMPESDKLSFSEYLYLCRWANRESWGEAFEMCFAAGYEAGYRYQQQTEQTFSEAL